MTGFNVELTKFDSEGFKKKFIEAAKNKFRAKLESIMPDILKEDPNAKITEDANGFPELEARISKKLRDKLKANLS